MTARRYRLRLNKDGSEVHTDRQYEYVLDLDGPGQQTTAATLDELLWSLAYADGARGERVARYHLAVHRTDDGAKVCDWPGRTAPQDPQHY